MTRMRAAFGLASLAVLATACGNRKDPALIVASGQVEATDVRISAKVGGRLLSFAIREGDAVTAGQELARIDTTDLKLTRRQIEAERGQAEAELKLRLAGAREQDLAELTAQLASVEAELAGAERDLERMQGLLDKDSGTTKARDDARTRRDMAAARRRAMEQALSRLRAGSRAEEIEASRARLAAVSARLAQLDQQLKDASIVSPLAGLVSEKLAEAGELVTAGAPLCVVTDLRDAWLTIFVSEPDLARIRIGQPAEVRTDDGQTRQGRVIFVASKAEFTPKNVQTRDERVKLVYRVKLGLDNADGLFKPGMPAEASLRATNSTGAAK
ncbi:MAG TPA: efflux RND transporter periplasmic adaptor subunit [Vicinamibacteria bacterium]|nr:efflux RND transporter periplasmic adaptor subunit [Vicinamibacteria bacterium]